MIHGKFKICRNNHLLMLEKRMNPNQNMQDGIWVEGVQQGLPGS